MTFSISQTGTHRYEKIGSQIVQHELNYIDKQREQPIFEKAREFYLQHQWKEAEHAYKKLLSINPNNATYHNSYSCILSRLQGQNVRKFLKLAVKHSGIATKLAPTNAEIRLNHIQFLTDLGEKDEINKQFRIIFDQLLSIPDNIGTVTVDVFNISTAFEYYSCYLFDIAEYEDATKYLEKACEIRRKFGQCIEQRVLHNLAQLYLKNEQVQTSLKYISTMEHINKKSIYEKFQSLRQNDDQPWLQCKAEVYLLIGLYQEAYSLLKYELDLTKQNDRMHSTLILYTQLIECCIELNKFEEASALDYELFGMYQKSPSILDLSRNKNIDWQREFLISYALVQKGGVNNAFNAVKYMEFVMKKASPMKKTMGNRMPCAHFYLGLAYRNMSKYANNVTDKNYYISMATFALYQAANLVPEQTKFMWEFAMTLFEGNELYLCKYYAIKSWKQCKQIECIKNMYPKMRKKWKRQMKRMKCSFCGKHKYLKSKKQSHKLKVCKGCHSFYYCNRKCQKQHWKKIHYKKCPNIWIDWNAKLLKAANNSQSLLLL